MTQFTDPNMFVHVRYNRKKGRPGRSIRVYEISEANTNEKITALRAGKKLKGPGNELLIFGDGSRVEGAHYQQLIDFLKGRDLFVNCLGRVLVSTVLHRDHPSPQAIEIQCLRVYDYFPWHEYGGPPSLGLDSSWAPRDLEGNKVDGQGEEEKPHGDDKLADLKGEIDKLQQKYDDLVKKKYEDYVPWAGLPIGSQSFSPYDDKLAFSPQQIASRDYGLFFGTDPSILNFQVELFLPHMIRVFTYGECSERPFNGSTRFDFFTMQRINKGYAACALAVVPTERLCSVDASVWRRIGTSGSGIILESKNGSIWSSND